MPCKGYYQSPLHLRYSSVFDIERNTESLLKHISISRTDQSSGSFPAAMAKSAAAKAKKEAKAVKKDEQLKEDLKKAVEDTASKVENSKCLELQAYFEGHPLAAAYVLPSIKMGAYDHLHKPEEMRLGDEEKLPAWQNKFKLLKTKVSVLLILSLIPPDLSEWCQKAVSAKGLEKREDQWVFGVPRVYRSPSKVLGSLKEWCGKRAAKFKRLENYQLMCVDQPLKDSIISYICFLLQQDKSSIP